MAGKWDYSLISRIQQANDIIDVISEHMNLEKKGKEMVGLCPFHTDHKPSLFVNPAKQIFKCFACGAGGDVLKFVQMKENLTFPQAVERLANRAGIAIKPISRQGNRADSEGLDAATLAKLNAWAMKHWMGSLWDTKKGTAVRAYLKQRGITEDSAKNWQLGLAIDAWDDLATAAAQKKIAAKYLIQGGLAVEKERGCYDKFRNRLMFPIVDVSGRVIGFGGRTLADDPAKYMNSPATALFDKSHSVYGLDRARQAISDSGTVVVVEGYTDVIMAHQVGVENVVAALGTSLTIGHAGILRRYAKRIVLIFDSDVAGRAAANRALEVCLAQKIDVQLAFVPDGKDPCDFLLESGPEAFRKIVESAEDVLEFKWNVLNEQLEDSQSLSDRTEAIRVFLQTAAAAFDARKIDSVAKTIILSRLSELLNIPSSRIEQEITAIQKQKRRTAQDKNDTANQSEVAEEVQNYIVKAQCEVLEVLLCEPDLFELVSNRITTDDFGPDPLVQELADVIFEMLSQDMTLSLSQLYGRIESEQTANLLTQLQSASGQKTDLRRQLNGAVEEIEKRKEIHQIELLRQRLDEDDELKRMHERISRKGPNLRSPGIRL